MTKGLIFKIALDTSLNSDKRVNFMDIETVNSDNKIKIKIALGTVLFF